MYSRSKHSPKKNQSSSKAKDSGAGSSNSFKNKEIKSVESPQVSEDKEITLPVFNTIDTEKDLQCYSSILNRLKEEGVGVEDLDRLQVELEMLLNNVALRERTLHSELALIAAAEENKSKRTASISIVKSKRHKRQDDKSELSENSLDNMEESKSELSNGTRDDHEDTYEDLKELSARHPPKRMIPLVPPSIVPVARNDMTNKFWSMVEAYCAEITLDDIKFLEDLVKSYDIYDKEEFKEIPPLGTHYSLKWNKKGVKEEKEDGWIKSENDVDEIEDTKDISTLTNNVPKMCVPGPMVQRLVSALVEENPSTSSGSGKRGRSDRDTDENSSQPSIKKSKEFLLSGFISSANGDFSEVEQNYRMLPFLHSSQCFEKKVRKELEAIGFLDPANDSEDDPDEILTELKRCHEELSNVATKNKKMLTHLLQVTKTEFKRQQIKNQIKSLNSEIADINMKNISLKLKKKHLCRKEAEDAWRLLKEREALINKLEELS